MRDEIELEMGSKKDQYERAMNNYTAKIEQGKIDLNKLLRDQSHMLGIKSKGGKSEEVEEYDQN